MTETVELPEVPLESLEALATGIFWFEAKGNRIFFKNGFRLFGDDGEDAPEEVLLTVQSIGGNYGTVVEAAELARFLTNTLNRRLSPRKFLEASRT